MYEIGIGVAFILELAWAVNTVMFCYMAGFKRENFDELGMRLSWNTGEPVPYSPFYLRNAYWLRPLKICAFLVLTGIFSLTSWFAVALFALRMVRWHALTCASPESKRIFQNDVSTKRMNPNVLFKRLVQESGFDDLVVDHWLAEVNARLESLGKKKIDYVFRSSDHSRVS
jgi:hypothetical protein